MKKPIRIVHRIEYCTKVDSPLVRAKLFRESLDISIPYLTPEHGWLASSAEFERKGQDYHSPLSYVRDAVVRALKGTLSGGKVSWVISGSSGRRGCECGRNHLILYREWMFKRTKRNVQIAESFVGKAWEYEEYQQERNALSPFWDDFEKEKARYETMEREQETKDGYPVV